MQAEPQEAELPILEYKAGEIVALQFSLVIWQARIHMERDVVTNLVCQNNPVRPVGPDLSLLVYLFRDEARLATFAYSIDVTGPNLPENHYKLCGHS